MLKYLKTPEDKRWWLAIARLVGHDDFDTFKTWLNVQSAQRVLESFRDRDDLESAYLARAYLQIIEDLRMLFDNAPDEWRRLEEKERTQAVNRREADNAPSGTLGLT